MAIETTQLDGQQGRGEQRTEVYKSTSREQSQTLTPLDAKSISRASGSARRQADAGA